MWDPPYDRDGRPFSAEEATLLSPEGELESGRRFLTGALRGSPSQRRRAMILAAGVVGFVLFFVVITFLPL